MARAQNIKIIGNLIDNFVHAELYDTQKDVESVFDMEDSFRDTIWMKMCIEHLKKNPDCSRIIQEKYIGPEYNLDEMLRLPTDSLGYTYAKLMSAKEIASIISCPLVFQIMYNQIQKFLMSSQRHPTTSPGTWFCHIRNQNYYTKVLLMFWCSEFV